MKLYRDKASSHYRLNVNGQERIVEKIVAYDKNGPIISIIPSLRPASNIWPNQIEIPNLDVKIKRKVDFTKEVAVVSSISLRGFAPRWILYLPASVIGLSAPLFMKNDENLCFEEVRTTNVDGLKFCTYHPLNAKLIAIDRKITSIGSALAAGVWMWDKENTLDIYVQSLQTLKDERETELARINEMTEEDFLKTIYKKEGECHV